MIDLYPDLGEEIDRRIRDSEHKIKYWVVVGVMAHVITLTLAMVPAVFYLGQISSNVSATSSQVLDQQKQIGELSSKFDRWSRNRAIWEMSLQSWAQGKGYQPAIPTGEP